jgi:outer membrane protein OmpA-like peptidoglycan-associated protein
MNTRNARRSTLGLTAAALVAGLPAWAATPADPPPDVRKAQNIGIATGLAVGAAAAGPFGAVLGAAAGGLLGDHYQRQKRTAAELSSDLGRSEAERARLNDSLKESRARGAQLEQTLSAVDEVGMELGFRTDDAAIKVEDLAPLLKLGALAAAMPGAMLRVAGYADPRGAAAYNDALSQRRAEAVAAALERAGVPRERLIIEAHGCDESTSAAGDLDAYALDRRVTVRLERPSVASSGSAGPAVVGP